MYYILLSHFVDYNAIFTQLFNTYKFRVKHFFLSKTASTKTTHFYLPLIRANLL